MLRLVLLFMISSWQVVLADQSMAEDIETLTVRAVAAHDEGEYQEAIDIYEGLIAKGHVNGHVYYNLGNAYYRLGNMGAATAAYLASAKYLPRSPDVSANLEYARKDAIDKLQVRSEKSWWAIPAFWSDYFSGKELAYAGAVSIGIGGVLWLLGWLIPIGISACRFMAIGAWGLALVVGYGMGVKLGVGSQWGAVTEATAQVYSGPNEKNNKSLFELHEAAPVLVQQQEQGWVQIQISDGKKGWIKRSSLKVY